MRVVLDTNIIVSACLNPYGPPAALVDQALRGVFTVCISQSLVAEYREVLSREKFSRSQERIRELLEGLEEIAVLVAPMRTLALSAHDEDNRILECAEAAQADFLVTGNAKHFPASLHNTRIINARNFLTRLGL